MATQTEAKHKTRTLTLEFKWGTSRGRDTYGYAICSLYIFGAKVASCNGGNYDMKGTSLGYWMQKAFADRLMKLNIPMSRRNGEAVREYYGLSYHDPNFDPGKAKVPGTDKTVAEREASNDSLGLERYQAFYRESSNVPTERHTVPLISWGVGFSSVERIGNAIGLTFTYVPTSSKNLDVYNVEVDEEWVPALAEPEKASA